MQKAPFQNADDPTHKSLCKAGDEKNVYPNMMVIEEENAVKVPVLLFVEGDIGSGLNGAFLSEQDLVAGDAHLSQLMFPI